MIASLLETTESEGEEAVAVFAPSAVLGNGTESGESDTVSDLAPLKCKHFVWKCFIEGPSTEFPLKISSLVDNGCHLVLICPDIVEKLGLSTFTLPTPEPIAVAIKDSKEKNKMILDKFVILEPTSLDRTWTSRRVRALITPNLCMPVIFGLPFLSHNNIVTDHALRSCIDKKNGYNLLHPDVVTPPIKTLCEDRRRLVDSTLEIPKEFNFVGAIKKRIETLALLDTLRTEEKKLKEDFHDLFKPIPHVNRLPTDCLAEIHLKDPTLRVKGRSYPCPRKYRESWQILIKQHLDAGRIQPSSSPHASPAFIVPKADPNALPRWVNDYRQLNANTVVDSHPLPRADDILNDCTKGKFFSTIDMTNSFFQTRMHPDHIHLTAVSTPFGLYEWLVMPMGLRNVPSIHQRRVTHALRDLLGCIRV